MGKLFAPRRAEPPCKNTLRELLENDFNVMFLPLFHLWEGEEDFTLKVPYGDDYRCRREPYDYRGFDTREYRQRMREGYCVLFEVRDLGSFLFTDHRHSDLFQGLQRSCKAVRSFVFCGNETGGYFKILENGRIRHATDTELDLSCANSARTWTGDAWRITRRGSMGRTAPLEAAMLAAWGVAHRPTQAQPFVLS